MLRDTMLKLRWRLLAGILSLVVAVGLTLPAAASKVNLGERAAQIWPNALTQVADVIWPNAAELMDVIWPNAAMLGDSLSGDAGQN